MPRKSSDEIRHAIAAVDAVGRIEPVDLDQRIAGGICRAVSDCLRWVEGLPNTFEDGILTRAERIRAAVETELRARSN